MHGGCFSTLQANPFLWHDPRQSFQRPRKGVRVYYVFKKFLTFSIPGDVGTSFYVLPTDRRQIAFILFFVASVHECVLFYLQRTLYALYANHVQLLNKKINIGPASFKSVGGLDWVYVT